MNRYQLITPAAAMIVCLNSCTVKRDVPFRPTADYADTQQLARHDYSTFSRIPDRPTSLAYRSLLKTIPYTRQRAFWGNWGGCGSKGGAPVDEMDEIFRRHDIIYYEARSVGTMRAADKACIAALERLDTETMPPQAREFHQRSIRFFSNPSYAPIGKPLGSFVHSKESPDSPFQTDRDVYRFFQIEDDEPSNFEDPTGRLQLQEAASIIENEPVSQSELPALDFGGWDGQCLFTWTVPKPHRPYQLFSGSSGSPF